MSGSGLGFRLGLGVRVGIQLSLFLSLLILMLRLWPYFLKYWLAAQDAPYIPYMSLLKVSIDRGDRGMESEKPNSPTGEVPQATRLVCMARVGVGVRELYNFNPKP